MTPEPFVTADEVAQHLKVTRRQVLAMTRKNLLPGHPICFDSGRRMWRFKLTEVDKTIASRTSASGVAVPAP
jgi:excisionase family DNA binding protein